MPGRPFRASAPAVGSVVAFVHAGRRRQMLSRLAVGDRGLLAHQLDRLAGVVNVSDLRFLVFHGFHLLSTWSYPAGKSVKGLRHVPVLEDGEGIRWPAWAGRRRTLFECAGLSSTTRCAGLALRGAGARLPRGGLVQAPLGGFRNRACGAIPASSLVSGPQFSASRRR